MLIINATMSDTWIVDDDGKADFNNIQIAIHAASNGDEIIVMPGTYTGTGNEVVNMLGKSIWLHSSNGPEETIIDGEESRRAIICQSSETANTIIEGFTLQNCSAPWYDWNNNNQIDYWEYFGGAVWIRNGSNPTILSCNFANNIAEYGAGIYNGDENGISSNPEITNCIFQNNSAGNGVGGGIYNISSSPLINQCEFFNNTAYYGGGMMNWEGSNPTVINCSFINNSAISDGGGMYTSSSMPTLNKCIFRNNQADEGAGVFNADPSSATNVPLFQHCMFIDNIAYSDGGAMHNFSISPLIINCTFKRNQSENGGAIYSWNLSEPTIMGSWICENTPDQIVGTWLDKGSNTIAFKCDECPDINGDGYVNVSDVLAVIDQWGTFDSPADVNYDGTVNVSDLLMVISNWGECS